MHGSTPIAIGDDVYATLSTGDQLLARVVGIVDADRSAWPRRESCFVVNVEGREGWIEVRVDRVRPAETCPSCKRPKK